MNRRDFLIAALAPAIRGASLSKEVIGANTAMSGYGLDTAIAAIRRLGFPGIEIHPMGVPEPTPEKFPGFEFDRLSEPDKQNIRKSLAGFRHITTHLPYTGLSPFARDRQTAQASARTIETAMEATAFFGAELAVLHAIAPSGWSAAEARPTMLERIRDWGDYAAAHRFRIAIETGYPGSVAEFVGFIQEIDHAAVGCTIDVGHQRAYKELVARVKPEERGTPAGIRAYNDTTHAIIDALREKIWHFHVHDIEPDTWQEHRPIGTGFVDYPRLIAKLKQIGYGGLLLLEIAGKGSEIETLLADSKRRLEAYL